MSSVSNDDVWKRIRAGLFGLTFLDLSLCDTHLTRTLGGFPTVVSGLVEDLGDQIGSDVHQTGLWIGLDLDVFRGFSGFSGLSGLSGLRRPRSSVLFSCSY